MKYCSHCGKELADEAAVCPYCGASTGAAANVKAAGKLNKKVLAAVAVLLAVILAAGAFLLRPKQRELTEEEKYALQVVQKLKENLLIPDSIQIYDMYVNLYDEDMQIDPILSETIGGAYIHYSATNRGGGITENEQVAFIGEEDDADKMSLTDKDGFCDALKQINQAQGNSLSDQLVESLANRMFEDAKERFKDKGIEIDAEWINSELNK